MQAETAPLHRCMQQSMQSVGQLKSRVSSGNAEARPETHDPARRGIAFIGVGSVTAADERIAGIHRFMTYSYTDFKPIAIFPFRKKVASHRLMVLSRCVRLSKFVSSLKL